MRCGCLHFADWHEKEMPGIRDAARRQCEPNPKFLVTVLIRGLITSTVLTLFVLPKLYHWLEGRAKVAQHGILQQHLCHLWNCA